MILISPYARPLPNGNVNPKNYPYWEELISRLKMWVPIIQVGVKGEVPLVEDFRPNLPIPELEALIKDCWHWVSVDSFFQHLAWQCKKPGIVLFGQSDPNIFGHPENINLLANRSYLRKNQFHLWSMADYIEEAFVKPREVELAIRGLK